MKKVTLLSLIFSASLVANALTTIKSVGGDINWNSVDNWRIGDTTAKPTAVPNDNTLSVNNQWNANTILVDGTFTVGQIRSNTDNGFNNNGSFVWDLNFGGVINIDLADASNASKHAVSAALYGSSKEAIYSQDFMFSGGTVNIYNSTDTTKNAWIILAGTSKNAETAGVSYTKSITFDAQNTLNIQAQNIYLKADTEATQYKKQLINLYGTTNIFTKTTTEGAEGEDPVTTYTYHKTYLGSFSDKSNYQNTILNIGDPQNSASANTTAVFTCGTFIQESASEINLNGTMNVHGRFYAASNNGLAKTKINIASGATMNVNLSDSNSFDIYGTDLTVSGKLIIDNRDTVGGDGYEGAYNGSNIVVNNGGSITVKSTTGKVGLFALGKDSTLTVNKGGKFFTRNQLRFDGNNAKVILYEKNALSSEEGNWKIIAQNKNVKDAYIEFYADQDLKYFSWWQSDTEANTFHVKIGKDVDLITLLYLAENNATEGLTKL